jgi:hypothetical protein
LPKRFALQAFTAMAALVWWMGCAAIGPPVPPSLELPQPPTDLRAARKGDRVTLTWSIPQHTTDRQKMRYLGKTNICRSLDAAPKQCGTVVGEATAPADFANRAKTAGQKVTASFVDPLPSALEREHAAGFATYTVEVMNTAGRGAGVSNQVRVALVPTLPPFPSFAAQATGQGVLISWRCPAESGRRTGVKYLFRIYRRPESSASATRIAELDATECGRLPATAVEHTAVEHAACEHAAFEHEKNPNSFLDQSFEWEKTYFYRGTVVSVIAAAGKPAVEVEGDDTPEVKVFAHDVFPPAVPSGLQAVYSGPGQQAFIDLIWAPVTDADLDGYNVYRHEEGGAAVKLNTEPVKVPAFRDAQVVAGKTYFYSVSAVDLRGNESARSEAASESVPGNL